MPRKDRSLMEGAYEEIKRRVITLELPPATRLDDRDLSAQLNLSRTPVREAIFRLGAEGFIDLRAEGFVVRPLDLVDIAHFFEAHIVLSRAVARLAARRATPAQLEQLRAAADGVARFIEQRDYLGITAANAQLHRTEAAAADSTHLGAMAASLHDHGQRLAYLCYGGRGGYSGANVDEHLRLIADQHEQLLAAIARRDPDAAEAVAVEHVRTFRNRVKQFLDGASAGELALESGSFDPDA
jgi:DNA-binding GntR family transcriptional regulator